MPNQPKLRPLVFRPEIVTRLRKEFWLSKQSLADKTGLRRETISRIENGQKLPSISTLLILAECFGTRNINQFYTLDRQKKIKFQLLEYDPAKITELREKANIEKVNFARLTKEVDPTGKGLSLAMISRLESGERLPGVDSLGLIAGCLRTTNINQFFKIKGDNKMIRDKAHYVRLLNDAGSVNAQLAARAIYAARHGKCESEDCGEEWKEIVRELIQNYGEDNIDPSKILEILNFENGVEFVCGKCKHKYTRSELVENNWNCPGCNKALVSIRELRTEAGIKTRVFDSTVLDLAKHQKIFLHKHIHPYRLTDKDKEELVTDGKGNYYVGLVLRGKEA